MGGLFGGADTVLAVLGPVSAGRAEQGGAGLAEQRQGLAVLGAPRPRRHLLQGPDQPGHVAQAAVGALRARLQRGAALRAGGGARGVPQHARQALPAEAVPARREHGLLEHIQAQRAGGLGQQLLLQSQRLLSHGRDGREGTGSAEVRPGWGLAPGHSPHGTVGAACSGRSAASAPCNV